jgi:hypothetical protein
VSESQNNSNGPARSGPPSGGGGPNRKRRYRGNRGGAGGGQSQGQSQGQGQGQGPNQPRNAAEGRPAPHSGGGGGRNRRPHGRVLTSNQVLVKYDNLLEQHLITRRKYYEYYNRVDERNLYRLEKNFFDSIEHLRRFEASLEGWQREALEKRKTERYRIDSTYSDNRGLDPLAEQPIEVAPEEIEDPHFKDTQKEAYVEYQDDTEESEGSFEDYLKLKGLN